MKNTYLAPKNKLANDKYYTPSDIADYCIKKAIDIIGLENIKGFIEPSAGSGVFTDLLEQYNIPIESYDILPDSSKVVQQDFLELNKDYREGFMIIGNPPFGVGNYTSVKFFKKSILLGDYVAFIQPISQLNNNMYMYEFDMIHSESLGNIQFSDKIKVKCCFNIYKKNPNGYNGKPNYDMKSVLLRGVSTGAARNDKIPENYDFTFQAYGSFLGKISKENEYAQQMYVTVLDKNYVEPIKKLISETKWLELYEFTATPSLKQWQVLKEIKKHFPNLE